MLSFGVEKAMGSASTPPQRPSPPIRDACPPDPDVAPTEAADEAEMPLPSDPQTFFLLGLFILGALAAVYVASAIILPVVLAFALKLLLQSCVSLSVCMSRGPSEPSCRSCWLSEYSWVLWRPCRPRRDLGGEIA